MKIAVHILSYKLPWAKMFVWLTSGDSPAARTWLIATAISVGLKGSKGCADWDLYCTGNPADSSQVSKISINLSKKSTNAPIFPSLVKNLLAYLIREERPKDRQLQGCHQTWIMVFLHFWVGLSLNRISTVALQGLEASRRFLPLCKDEHLDHARTSQPTPISPKSNPLSSHSWLKMLSSPDTFTMIRWIIDGRVH